MRPSRTVPALAILAALSTTAQALDLARVDRGLTREPAYGKTDPRYALVVFGPEAKGRLWLVAAGHTLHVDRNGNGDLTDDGPPVAGTPSADGAASRFLVEGLTAWDGRKAALRVMVNDETALHDGLHLILDGRPYQSASFDADDAFRFAYRPSEAPLVHFGGPLQITLRLQQALRRGTSPKLMTMIGTPGLGGGTFAALDFPEVPAGADPVAEIEFPAGTPDASARTVRVALSERCCTCNFQGKVSVPADLGPEPARVTLSVPGWPEARIAPAAFRLPIK